MKVVFANSKLLKKIFNFSKDVNKEINILFTEEMMDITCMGESFCTFVQIHIPSSSFSEYEVSEATEVGLNMDVLCKCLSASKDNDIIEFSMSSEDHLDVSIADRYDYQLPTIDILEERLEVPDTQYEINYEIKCSNFSDTIKNLAQFCDDSLLSIEEKKIEWSSSFSDQSGKMNISWTEEDILSYNCEDVFSGSFSIKYLSEFIKINTISDNMKLFSSTGIPLHLHVAHEDIHINYFIAPKIEEDG